MGYVLLFIGAILKENVLNPLFSILPLKMYSKINRTKFAKYKDKTKLKN